MTQTIKKIGEAGTLESSDAMVIVKPLQDKGIIIEISSIVEKQYLKKIEETVKSVLKELNIESIYVKIEDRGALDCTIRARLETAIERAIWVGGETC